MENKNYQKNLDDLKVLNPSEFSSKEEYENALKEKTTVLQEALDELYLYQKDDQAVEVVMIKDAVGQRIFQCPHCKTMVGVDLDKLQLLSNRYCKWCGKKLSTSEVETEND